MKKVIVSVLVSVIILAGCQIAPNTNVIDELAIVLALGVDKDEDDPSVTVITTSNPTFSQAAETDNKVTVVKGYGVRGAFKNWQYQRQKELALGKVGVVVFGSNQIEAGLATIIPDLRQTPDMNVTAKVIYYDGEPSELLQLTPAEEARKSIFLNNLIEQAELMNITMPINLCELGGRILTTGKDGFLPYVEKTEAGSAKIAGLALLDETGSLATIINDSETLLLSLLMKYQDYTTISTKIPEIADIIVFQVKGTKNRYYVEIKNGKPVIEIRSEIVIEISEVSQRDVEIMEEEFFEDVKKHLSADLTKTTTELVQKFQKYNTDPIGLGEIVRVRENDYYKKGTWRDDYPNIDIRSNVNVKVIRGNVFRKNL
ncbi:Ger(x)C family spore germination protein [Alkalicella caledoniensis]|uniref:Ger(X)C family spore germination protein n=1 Tax=Alkalicella caledoniensis TaxID=2731377 RepID=A0A7G9W743_ALKCA|nr:Ger(x)C family spore germination protein [Alkalicella caledoniensis]QNO14505.1 Ger(x)C family spore germination protein [Alkalicella caledoniensis]